MSKVVYKASCWDCQDSYIGKTKRRLHDRKTEHFKGITSTCLASAIADHVTANVDYQVFFCPFLKKMQQLGGWRDRRFSSSVPTTFLAVVDLNAPSVGIFINCF